MARLSREQVAGIIKSAPAGSKPEAIVRALVDQGHTLEGYNEAPAEPSFKERAASTISGIARPALETAGMLGGAALAGAGTLPAGPVAIPAAAAGGALGYAVGTAGADLVDRALGVKAPIKSAGEAVKETASNVGTGAALEATGAVIGKTAGAVASAAGPVAKKALGFMAKTFGSLSDETVAMLEKNAPNVVKYARQGVDAAKEAAASAAKAVKTHIENYADKAGESYRAAIDKIVSANPEYNGLRIDLQRLTGDDVAAIRSDFGFPDHTERLPNLQLLDARGTPIQAAQGEVQRVGKAASDVRLFNAFTDQFKKSMTPTQAYLLQKDLSYAIRANADKPIAAALGKLKKLAVGAFDAVVQNTPLSKVNSDYRVAMSLAEDLSKVSNADNAVTTINTAFRNRGETRDALNTISAISPGVKSSLEDLFAATAGQHVAHWTVQLPPTGAKALYQLGLGAGGAAMIHNPITGVPAAAGYLAGTSPRVYGEAFNALSGALPSLPRAGSAAALAALRARRNQ